MKTLGALAFALTAPLVMAQSVTTGLMCADWPRINQTLQQYQESPMLRMQSLRKINGEVTRIPAVVFVNATTGTYTLVERWDEDQYCVILVGEHFTPYQSDHN